MVLFQTVQRAEQAPSQEVPAEAEPVPSTAQTLPPPKKEEGEEAPSTPQLLQPPKKEEGEEGEILSASPSSPAAKPMGKCYMDLEEGEVVGEGKEESKTESRRPDRWAGRDHDRTGSICLYHNLIPRFFQELGNEVIYTIDGILVHRQQNTT